MNCQMADKSVDGLMALLKKPNLEELRLHNVRGLGDLQSAKPQDSAKDRDHCREPLLATVLEEISAQNTLKVL